MPNNIWPEIKERNLDSNNSFIKLQNDIFTVKMIFSSPTVLLRIHVVVAVPAVVLGLVVAGFALVASTRAVPASVAESPEVETVATPVGTVIAFAGAAENLPAGWFPCDGRALGRDPFSELGQSLAADQ